MGRSVMPRQGSKAIGEVVNGVIPGQRFLSGARHIGPTVHESWCDKEASILETRRLDRWHSKYDGCDWNEHLKTHTPRRPEEERMHRERYKGFNDVTKRRPLASPRDRWAADPCNLPPAASAVKSQRQQSSRLAKPKVNLLAQKHEKKMEKMMKTPRR